jgi:hypothetical protein
MKIFTLTAGFYLHFQLDHSICNVEENVYFHDLYVILDHVWAIFYLMIVFDLAVILSFFIGFFFYGFLYKMNMLKISTKSQ